MFKAYQGGPFVDVFSTTGSGPPSTAAALVAGKKVYERRVKSYAVHLAGSKSSKLSLPKSSHGTLNLMQPFLVVQCLCPFGEHICFELSITDITGNRRRYVVSSFNRELKTTSLHCMLPMADIVRDQWLNLVFDLPALVGGCFRGQTFKHLDNICISGTIQIKRIFTLKDRPIDASGQETFGTGVPIPRAVAFAIGVEHITQIYQLPVTQKSSLPDIHDVKKSRSSKTIAFGRKSDFVLPPPVGDHGLPPLVRAPAKEKPPAKKAKNSKVGKVKDTTLPPIAQPDDEKHKKDDSSKPRVHSTATPRKPAKTRRIVAKDSVSNRARDLVPEETESQEIPSEFLRSEESITDISGIYSHPLDDFGKEVMEGGTEDDFGKEVIKGGPELDKSEKGPVDSEIDFFDESREEAMEREMELHYRSQHHDDNVGAIHYALETESRVKHSLDPGARSQEFESVIDARELRKELEAVVRKASTLHQTRQDEFTRASRKTLKSPQITERKAPSRDLWARKSRQSSSASQSYTPILDSIGSKGGRPSVYQSDDEEDDDLSLTPNYDAIRSQTSSRAPSRLKRSKPLVLPSNIEEHSDGEDFADSEADSPVLRSSPLNSSSHTPVVVDAAYNNGGATSMSQATFEEEQIADVSEKRETRKVRSGSRTRPSSILAMQEHVRDSYSPRHTRPSSVAPPDTNVQINDIRASTRPPSVMLSTRSEEQHEDISRATRSPSVASQHDGLPDPGLPYYIDTEAYPPSGMESQPSEHSPSSMFPEETRNSYPFEEEPSYQEVGKHYPLDDFRETAGRAPSRASREETTRETASRRRDTTRPPSGMILPDEDEWTATPRASRPSSVLGGSSIRRQDTAVHLPENEIEDLYGKRQAEDKDELDEILRQSLRELQDISKSLGDFYTESDADVGGDDAQDEEDDDTVELVFDADRQQYFDPRSGKYYELER